MRSPLALFVTTLYLINGDPLSTCPSFPNAIEIKDIENDPVMVEALKSLTNVFSDASNSLFRGSGLMTVAVYRDQIIYSKGYGRANFAKLMSGPPNLDTIVQIASITKTFTSLLAFVLRDDDFLPDGIDTNLKELYADFRMHSVYGLESNITLRELASHTSGLPKEIPCSPKTRDCTADTDPSEFSETEIRVLDALSEQFTLSRKFARPHYSNLAYAFLGRALGRAMRIEYEDLLKNKILHPINKSTHAGFSIDDYMEKHLGVGVGISTVAAIPVNQSWGSPSKGLKASARDMANYMSMILTLMNAEQDVSKVKTPFRPTTIDEWTRQLSSCHDGRTAYGLPWEFYFNKPINAWLMGKDGLLDGFCSSIMMVPELRLGVFAVAMDTTAYGPCNLTPNLHTWTVPALEILAPAIEKILKKHQSGSHLPSNYKDLLGKYSNSYGDLITVYVNGESLMANIDGSTPYNMTQVSDDDPYAFQVTRKDQSSISCRHLTDGENGEIFYFSDSSQHQYSNAAPYTQSSIKLSRFSSINTIYFMGQLYDKE